jgi:two-component system, cell cycle response regulator DivK
LDFYTAENGAEGLEMSFKYIPDLILMDMEMPVMDGWAAVPILRADIRTKSIPIVALTALAKPEDKVKTKELGCTEHMSKPIVTDELIALVKGYLNL